MLVAHTINIKVMLAKTLFRLNYLNKTQPLTKSSKTEKIPELVQTKWYLLQMPVEDRIKMVQTVEDHTRMVLS